MHQLPLTLIICYNNAKMNAVETAFDKTITAFVILNSCSITCELLFLRFFAANSIDLDRRVKWPEANRIKKLYIFCTVSVLGLVIYFYGIVPKIQIE